MKKLALTAICTLAIVGLAFADDFTMQITKISEDGATVTGTKTKGFGGFGGGKAKGEEVTIKVASGVQVYKGKFDLEAKGFVKEGDDLKVAGLKDAVTAAANGSVSVSGKTLTNKDTLELKVADGKPVAKLNGSAIEFDTVQVKGKAPLSATVTTDDSGAITTVIITPGFGGGFGKGKGKGGN
jgi:hypothetical protein